MFNWNTPKQYGTSDTPTFSDLWVNGVTHTDVLNVDDSILTNSMSSQSTQTQSLKIGSSWPITYSAGYIRTESPIATTSTVQASNVSTDQLTTPKITASSGQTVIDVGTDDTTNTGAFRVFRPIQVGTASRSKSLLVYGNISTTGTTSLNSTSATTLSVSSNLNVTGTVTGSGFDSLFVDGTNATVQAQTQAADVRSQSGNYYWLTVRGMNNESTPYVFSHDGSVVGTSTGTGTGFSKTSITSNAVAGRIGSACLLNDFVAMGSTSNVYTDLVFVYIWKLGSSSSTTFSSYSGTTNSTYGMTHASVCTLSTSANTWFMVGPLGDWNRYYGSGGTRYNSGTISTRSSGVEFITCCCAAGGGTDIVFCGGSTGRVHMFNCAINSPAYTFTTVTVATRMISNITYSFPLNTIVVGATDTAGTNCYIYAGKSVNGDVTLPVWWAHVDQGGDQTNAGKFNDVQLTNGAFVMTCFKPTSYGYIVDSTNTACVSYNGFNWYYVPLGVSSKSIFQAVATVGKNTVFVGRAYRTMWYTGSDNSHQSFNINSYNAREWITQYPVATASIQ